MRRLLIGVMSVAAIATACGEPGTTAGTTRTTSRGATTTSEPGRISTTSPRAVETTTPEDDVVPRCRDIELPTADPSFYRDTPKYVGNEMPVDEVRQWASQHPEFVEVWIDREHNGWVAAGFTGEVADRQEEIEEEFPDDGVVAVELQWTEAELAELEASVVEELGDVLEFQFVSIDMLDQSVAIQLPILSEKSLATIVEYFPDEPVCVEGLEPEDVVPPGPQPQAGDGWRLLADEDEVGDIYTSGLAWDEPSFQTLLETIPGLPDINVHVDWEGEVVIWFGAVHGSSCPNLRLDDVVVDGDVLHSVIVNTDNALACTDDAIPHAYLVAVDRSRLPAPPFYVALEPDSPGERLLVEADLRQPGSTAQPGQVRPDPDPPEQEPAGSGVIIEPGFPWEYTVDLTCGFEAIGEINSFEWVAAGPIPDSWLDAATRADSVVVEVLLHEGPEPVVEVTFQNETVVYEPADKVGCP